MKRRSSLAIVAAGALLALSACGGGGDPERCEVVVRDVRVLGQCALVPRDLQVEIVREVSQVVGDDAPWGGAVGSRRPAVAERGTCVVSLAGEGKAGGRLHCCPVAHGPRIGVSADTARIGG